MKYELLAGYMGAFATLHYASNNLERTTVQSSMVSSVLVFTCSFVVVTIAHLALRNSKIKDILLTYLILTLFIYYLRFPLTQLHTSAYHQNILWGHLQWYALSFLPVATVLLVWLLRKHLPTRIKKITALVIISCSLPAYKIMDNFRLTMKTSAIASDSTDLQLSNQDITFKKKTNVYFVFFDSYASIDSQQLLGIDTNEFLQELSSKKFTVYPSFFTNFQPTSYAIPSYFNMNTKNRGRLLYELSSDEKLKINAGANPVVDIFKNNQYDTRLIYRVREYFIDKYCFSQSCFPQIHQRSNMYESLFLVEKIIFGGQVSNIKHSVWDMNMPAGLSITERVSLLTSSTDGGRGAFAFVYFWQPGHADVVHTEAGLCKEQKEKSKYAQRVQTANKLIARIVNKITSIDKDAIIIIASDHGPYIYNGCSYIHSLSTREKVIERQGVFLAIRWGEDYDGRYDKDIKSSANLFRYIFSYLMGHEKLLENKPDDDAFYQYKGKVIKSIDDGVILPPPAAELPQE